MVGVTACERRRISGETTGNNLCLRSQARIVRKVRKYLNRAPFWKHLTHKYHLKDKLIFCHRNVRGVTHSQRMQHYATVLETVLSV